MLAHSAVSLAGYHIDLNLEESPGQVTGARCVVPKLDADIFASSAKLKPRNSVEFEEFFARYARILSEFLPNAARMPDLTLR